MKSWLVEKIDQVTSFQVPINRTVPFWRQMREPNGKNNLDKVTAILRRHRDFAFSGRGFL